MSNLKPYNKLLTIAGSDSGGGAGIQADLKTFSALGGYGMTVITALTAQNTQGVQDIFGIPPDFIKKQLDSIYRDMGTDAVKIGMLHSASVIKAVYEQIKKYNIDRIVLDPVMVAKSGDRLLQEEAITALKEKLIPSSYCITPNLPEAEVLLERSIDSKDELKSGARDLLSLGCENVLVKGGHLAEEEAVDVLARSDTDKVEWFSAGSVDTSNTHGTGCTLSSAIATYLGQGVELSKAIGGAKDYITSALASGARYRLGKGWGPVHHFYQFWD